VPFPVRNNVQNNDNNNNMFGVSVVSLAKVAAKAVQMAIIACVNGVTR